MHQGQKNNLRFCDVFAGCGGLSLGLLKAGCTGLFAVEKSPLAFDTFKHNLVDGKKYKFEWPSWLPKEATTCEELIDKHSDKIGQLAGDVDLIVGGPPCQGFSLAGKRDPADPRNKMTEQYLSFVGLMKPRFIVIENVSGFDMEFSGKEGDSLKVKSGKKHSYAAYVAERLKEMGYRVNSGLVNCADFGVPQRRHRFLMICERETPGVPAVNLFKELQGRCKEFRRKRGLPTSRHVSVKSAISDLETVGRPLVASCDYSAPGFKEAEYKQPRNLTAFQSLMRKEAGNISPNSRRLANHRKSTITYFEKVQAVCRPGLSLSIKERKKVGTKKHSTTVLNSKMPSPTITTLPDDIIHYKEPRILTVRENARIQSFPDWFEFLGKYTTGGKQRKQECPRYTQVGNAVPPLLSEALGELLIGRLSQIKKAEKLASKVAPAEDRKATEPS
jgi:DNA (cytosine-5)-methyltransferase 1